MKYEEIVEKVRSATSKANVSRAVGHIAFQFNIEGEGEGAFYLEIADGKVYVEPYEYYDRDVIIVTTADVIMQMIEGGLQPMVAYTNEQMKVYGNIDHLKVLPLGCDCKQVSKQETEPEKAVETEKKAEEPVKTVENEEKAEEPVKTAETEQKVEEPAKTTEVEKKVEEPVKATTAEKKSGTDKKLRKKHLRK